MTWTLRIAGALLVATGAVWTLQGVGMLGGSPMTGDRTWAVVGPVVAVVGLVLIALGLRRAR